MIDFDNKFQKYFEKWAEDNAGKYTYDQMEDMIPSVYAEWLGASDEELGGKSVDEYVSALSVDQLMSEFLSSFDCGVDPAIVILDRIEQLPSSVDCLAEILEGEYEDAIKIHSANLIREMDMVNGVSHTLVKWLFSDEASADLKDVAVELLTECPNTVKDKLLERVDRQGDENLKALIVEILVNAEKDDRTFDLLCDLFQNGTNKALYASYFAKYGDERAAALLYKALDDCSYIEFTEIRNAIETLGGVVDDDYRDFSDDKDYQVLKNLK